MGWAGPLAILQRHRHTLVSAPEIQGSVTTRASAYHGSRDVFDVTEQDCSTNLGQAAHFGDRNLHLAVGLALDTGRGLGIIRQKCGTKSGRQDAAGAQEEGAPSGSVGFAVAESG